MARFEYVNDTIQELFVQTHTVYNNAIREVRALVQADGSTYVAPTCNGAWAATDTTLAFTGLTGSIPPMGTFLVPAYDPGTGVLLGFEKIQYGAISWTAGSTSAGNFTSCKRGWEGTTAYAHANGNPLYWGDAFAQFSTTLGAGVVTIPFTTLDRPGIGAMGLGQIPETGIVQIENERIWYGAVQYTNAEKTAGNLLYCFRGYNGSTDAAHTINATVTAIPIVFEHVFVERENFAIYNYASGSTYRIFYGFNPTITNTGTNALPIEFNDYELIPVGGRVRVYVIITSGGNASGPVAIAEWR